MRAINQLPILVFLLFLIVCISTSCSKKVSGDVHIYGDIRDAYDNAPISDISLRLFRDNKNSLSEVFPNITLDSNSGTYDVKLITDETAKRGYLFEWQPLGNEEYYFAGNELVGSQNIRGNDCPIDIRLQRMGYMTVRLIDVAPFNFLPYPEFSCDGNRQPVNLYNFDGDTTFTVKLIPNHDNFYELISRSGNFTDTIIAGVINMNLSGDTLYNTLQF